MLAIQTIKKYISSQGNTNEFVLWDNILVFIENKGTDIQKQDLNLLLAGKFGTIDKRNFIDQFLFLTKDKISGKTDSLLLFSLFSSVDSALIKN